MDAATKDQAPRRANECVVRRDFCAARSLLLAGIMSVLPSCDAGTPAQGMGHGYRIFVSNEEDGTVSIVDGDLGKVRTTVNLGKRPRGMAIDPTRGLLFVALTGSPTSPPGTDERNLPPADRAADGVAVLNLTTERVQRVLKGIPDPEQVAVAPNGTVYAGSELAGAVIGDVGGTPRNAPVGGEPEGVAVTRDGRTLLVSMEENGELVLMDLPQLTVRTRIKVGKRSRTVAVSPNGRLAFVSNELDATVSFIDLVSRRVTHTVAIPGRESRPMGLAVSPDSGTLYVTNGRGGSLLALSVAKAAVKASVHVGQRPWGVALSPDGRYAITANGPSNDISVVDVRTMRVRRQIAVGKRPWGIAVTSDIHP